MVPDIFINTYMKDANIAQVKVYLCLLYMEKEQQGTDISEIADEYNFTERDVVRSLLWLEERGLIKLFIKDKKLESVTIIKQTDAPGGPAMSGHVLPAYPTKEAAVPSAMESMQDTEKPPAAPDAVEENPQKKEDIDALPAPKKLSPAELAEYLGIKENLYLKEVIEQYIGKPLTQNDISEICYISKELHFSNDLIDYLVQYAVDRKKKKMSYIRGIAQKWAVYGIMTVPQAVEKGEEAEEIGKKRGRKASGSKKQTESLPMEEHWEGEGSYIENHQQKYIRPNSRNAFNNFTQNVYDFDALERELLGEE